MNDVKRSTAPSDGAPHSKRGMSQSAVLIRLPERKQKCPGHMKLQTPREKPLATVGDECRPPGMEKIIGRDMKMLDVFEQVCNVAAYDYPVHIFGETGTGKELIAEAIHKTGPRKNGPFVPINCGALPESLIESELFGHTRGAFSGAVRNRKGRFELADGGTVFLDEVAELSKYMQVKLLRFLQDGKFERVGGERTVRVNVRILSATNKNLKDEMEKGHFREDLYYRLKVIPLNLPPLRERTGDIPLLVTHFLNRAAGRYNCGPLSLSANAQRLLDEYHWPGNVRELQNTVQFAIVHCRDKTIGAEDLPVEIAGVRPVEISRGPNRKLNARRVRYAMEKTGGNKAKAARLLNVGRATLYRFFEDFPELQPSV